MSKDIDILIAEKIFPGWWENQDQYPQFSKYRDIAFMIIEKLGNKPRARWFIETNYYEDKQMMYWVMYDPDDSGDFGYTYESPSLAEAICKVALMYAEKHER